MDNQEKSQIEMLLDENNTENIKLYDENNKETEFEQVALIPLDDDRIYVILKPVTKITGVNDDEALVFVIEEIDDEECLVIVDDEDIVDKVFDEYYALLKEQGIDIEDVEDDNSNNTNNK
jgi:ribosome assembly protein YihI (activator of Der GTPase)